MKILDILKTANSNLKRAKLRTALTLLAIIVGTFTISITTAVGEGVKDYIDKQTSAVSIKDGITIFTKDFFSGGDSVSGSEAPEYKPEKARATTEILISDEGVNTISKLDGVKEVYPIYQVKPEYISTGSSKKYVLDLGQYFDGIDFPLAAGKLPTSQSDKSILLAYKYVKAFGFSSPQDAVGKNVNIVFKNAAGEEKTVTLNVSGVIVNSLMGQTSRIGYDISKEIYEFQAGKTSKYAIVFAKLQKDLPKEKLDALKKQLDDKGYIGQTFEDNIAQIKSIITIAQSVLAIFGFIVILAAALGIINTLFMGVYERTREIGLMKALGMRKRGIFAIFSFEAIALGFWGGLIGVVFAIIVGSIINAIASKTILKDFEGFNLMTYPIGIMVWIIIGTMIVGLVAGTLPALKAAKLNPIDALRYE